MPRKIMTMDVETDPFETGLEVAPFAVGLYDGKNFTSVWGQSCIKTTVNKILKDHDDSIIFMHNGGRFDVFFFMDHMDAEMRIINGRIVEAKLGNHLVRDSYAMIPIALKQFEKVDINIQKLHKSCRDEHREEIIHYLKGDCVHLYTLVTEFIQEFGDFQTIGSAAMNQLRKFHPFERGTGYMDDKFRSQFFFGGRVQCFESGVIKRKLEIVDVNSMYPDVMKNQLHPVGKAFSVERSVTKKTAFVVAQGKQMGPYGAFPMRTKKGIDFTLPEGQFHVTIHEWNAALETGWFKPTKILKCYDFDDWSNFDEFVDHFYTSRNRAKKNQDKLRDIFYKLILNSAYGKFAQNPSNFFDWAITKSDRPLPEPWREAVIHKPTANFPLTVWKRTVDRRTYYNVATGASITGAARAKLMLGIRKAQSPVYVDTDSIVCSKFPRAIDEKALGEWKLEGTASSMAIAGKKLYSCFDDKIQGPVRRNEEQGFASHQCVKIASKGVKISPHDILKVAQGDVVRYTKISPTYKLNGTIVWLERDVRKTA